MFSALQRAVSEISEFIDSKNRITLVLNKSFFLPGEVVTGNVHMSCIVPFNARGVYVKVKGFERAAYEEIRQTNDNGQQRSEVIVHRQKRHFFNVRLPVYAVQGAVPPGEYDFPFSYQLPLGLAGSFHAHDGHWGSGHAYEGIIEYSCKANVDVQFKHNLHAKALFVINERHDSVVTPSTAENSKTFLLTPGRLSAHVWLDRNVYMPGNTVVAKLECNNTSVKPTTKIVIKVMRHVRLHVGPHRTVSTEVYCQHYNGLDPMFFGVKWMPFPIPVNIQPSSTLSPLVKCHYDLHVICDIPMAVDLEMICRVVICAPQWLYSTAPPAPQNPVLPPNVSYRPPWQKDDDVKKCNGCQKGFGVFLWRHHCRHCGRVFCDKCLPHKMPLPQLGFDEPSQVCEGCCSIAKQGGKRLCEAPVYVPTPLPENFAAPPNAPPSGQPFPAPEVPPYTPASQRAYEAQQHGQVPPPQHYPQGAPPPTYSPQPQHQAGIAPPPSGGYAAPPPANPGYAPPPSGSYPAPQPGYPSPPPQHQGPPGYSPAPQGSYAAQPPAYGQAPPSQAPSVPNQYGYCELGWVDINPGEDAGSEDADSFARAASKAREHNAAAFCWVPSLKKVFMKREIKSVQSSRPINLLVVSGVPEVVYHQNKHLHQSY